MATPAHHPFRSPEAKAEYEVLYASWARSYPVPSEPVFVDTPSGRTFVRVSGPTNAPPLVLLHGARGTSLMWAPNIEAWSAAHRVYAVETVGDVGLSVPRRPMASADDLATWLDELFGVLLPGRRFDLVGLSFGGWLTALYALRRPERLGHAVLISPGGTVAGFSVGFFLRVMLILAIRRPGANESALRRTLRWIFADAIRKGGESRRFVEEVFPPMLLAGRLFALPLPPWPKALPDEAWARLRVPMLFLVGEHEKIYSPQRAVRRLQRVAPQVVAEVVPGAGHDLGFVEAQLVNRRVLDFLAQPGHALPPVPGPSLVTVA